MAELTAAEKKHRQELYDLAEQCKECRFRRKDAPTKDCNIHRKLVVDDSPIAWKHKQLFLVVKGGVQMCKMFQGK